MVNTFQKDKESQKIGRTHTCGTVADESKEQYDEAEGWEFMNMPGDKKVGVRTSLLDDKCGAIELIGCYASHLRAALQPYIEEIKEIALPLLTFYLHADVRKATATIIPLIVGVYKEAGASMLFQKCSLVRAPSAELRM